MSQNKILSAPKLVLFLVLAALITIAGCSLEKKSWVNRNLQNLTTHYNILFNAREIIRLKEISYAGTFSDNYNEILSVYPDTIKQTGKLDKDLEDVIYKANKIINNKEQSHYIGDAYLVMGKAYYLEGNYFTSAEFFSYVIKNFPTETKTLQEALAWKARSLMYLNHLPQAKLSIDSALNTINYKKHVPANLFATKLLFDLNALDYPDAEKMAEQAVKYADNEYQRLRWTFILGQVYELNQKQQKAKACYTSIFKSNSSFEMAFNASLNIIRIEGTDNNSHLSSTQKLLALLKNPNNKEFKDQIYYQVAEIRANKNEIDSAIKYYKLSVRTSLKNQNQKGLSYLKLAENYFKNKSDYLTAKKYYDSTLTTLPFSFPGYSAIQKTGNNLSLLASKLQIIVREDTLQALAKMEEKPRLELIDKMVKDKVQLSNEAAAIAATMTSADPTGDEDPTLSSASGGSNFYFYNATAVSQGFTEFKQKWGNIKLEDNWRISSKAVAEAVPVVAASKSTSKPIETVNKADELKNKVIADNYRNEIMQGLPLTPEALAKSTTLLYNTYFDLANIYRDIMNDNNESIKTFKHILVRFPANQNKPIIYYSLYRLYKDIDETQANFYKSKILSEYPETAFAGVIKDPDYIKKQNEQNDILTQAYSVIFDLFTNREYKEVIICVPELLRQYPANKYSAQLYYLKTIAEGHFEKLKPFSDSLDVILKKYPEDKLIDPLINQHKYFITANQGELLKRDTLLKSADTMEAQFTLQEDFKKNANIRKDPKVVAAYVQSVIDAEAKYLKENPPKVNPQTGKPMVVKDKKADKGVVSKLFNLKDSTNYYFVINVSVGDVNLSSSRYGIGQFTRTHYAGMGIKHQEKDAGNDNQLIYVGLFTSLNEVKKYAADIQPLLADIMKVPKDKYSVFVITQENLNKLADKKTLDNYIDYYQQIYQP